MNHSGRFKILVYAFNFERVKKAMDAVDWNYTGSPVTVEELRDMVWTLYEGCKHWDIHERCSTSSGGFTIKKPHGQEYLILSFCIEEVTTQGEEGDNV